MSQLDDLSDQEIVDHVVAVALGEKKDKLPAAEKLMAALGMDEPVATESVTWPVGDPENYEPESAAFYLGKSVNPARLKRIEQGAKLTAKERSLVMKAATLRKAESGVFDLYRYYRVTDSKGRSVYFSERSGDDLGSCGPSSCHDGPLLALPYEIDTETQLEDGAVVKFYIIE